MNKLNSLLIAILTSSLVLPTVYAGTLQQVSNQPTSILANNTLSSEQIRQLAQSVTVKVLSQKKGGSGVLISKQGKTYTILTNAHVISSKGTHSIQTFDGKTHTATVISRGDSLTGNDLAVLQFESQENYQIVSLASTSNLSENQEVFAAGFPDDSKELVITNGKISLLSSQPLIGGYQIGYTNKIRQGMSGGALLNQSGQLIGVNGLLNNAILNEAYFYQDGTQPNAEQLQQLKKFSFAVPIQTLAKVSPNLAIIPPEWRNQQQVEKPSGGNTLADKVNNIAQQITVRIDSKNHGNGSGVIIAKQGQTYYVVTAAHVVENPDNYEIITPDGKPYIVQPENIAKAQGLDIALVKFTSNQTYSIATIAKYNLYYSSSDKKPWIFVSGFPEKEGGKRKLTAGLLSKPETVFSRAENLDVLNFVINVGYGLTYSNLTQPGMSGGAVLDATGQIIGINTGIEDKGSNQVELGLGLGVPSDSILGLAKKSGLKPELLKIVTTAPPKLTEAEINSLQNNSLFTVQKPSENASEYDWLNYANQLWRLNKYSEAVEAFQEAIKLKPSFYQAYYALGVALLSQKKYPEALAASEQAIKIKPDYEVWALKSVSLIQLKKYSEALAAIEKAIEYNDSNVFFYVLRGQLLSSLKRYPEALVAVTKAIEMKPLSNYYTSRGDIRYLSNDYQGALADYNQAIQLDPDSPENYLWRANVRSLLKDNQGALADCNQAIKSQPDNGDGYSCRGSVRFDLKDYQGALVDLNQAIKFNPDDITYYFDRAKVREILQDYKAALADYNQAIKIQPELPIVYTHRGSMYWKLKDYKAALADYNQAIQLDPNDAVAYSYRGNVYGKIKDYQRALADLAHALQLQPQLPGAYFIYLTRSNIYKNLKDYQAALADANKLIQLQPNNVSGYSTRSIIYIELKDYQAALADANQWIKLEPKDANAYLSRSIIYDDLKDYQAALADANQGIQLQPDLAQAYSFRSGVHQNLKDYQAALADLDQLIKLEPNDGLSYALRGILHYRLKDYQRALVDFDRAIILQQNNAMAYLVRGDIHKELKDYQAALTDYNQAIKLQPDNARGYLKLAGIHSQLKDYQAALTDYNQVIKLQPDNANAYFSRGVVYQKQGNNNAALSDYNQALTKDAKLAPAIINIGYIKYENGDVEGAIQQWEKAVQINSTLAEPQMALAVALYAKGEQQKALKMAQAALRLDKSFADVEVLKRNLWRTRLVAEAQKLFSHPSIQAWRTKQ
ncbi:MAG: tetratricopeptide repeat protein [Nostoc sp. CreGUA01]|nr:tetratricopeptide repeat protein [Nostoc sp. CreGUA01]